jgi:hypothetical protein
MRLMNPVYVAPVGPLATFKAQIDAYFANNPGVESVTFDQLRAFFGKTAAQWPDGAVHMQLLAWGYQVAPG